MLQPALLTRMSIAAEGAAAASAHGADAAADRARRATRRRRGGRALRSPLEGVSESVVAAGEDEVGAGAGERAGEVLAEAAAGSGDEGDSAGEVEELRVGGGNLLCWSHA